MSEPSTPPRPSGAWRDRAVGPVRARAARSVNPKLLRIYHRSAVAMGVCFCGFFAYFATWLNFAGPAVFLVVIALSILAARSGHYTGSARVISFGLWAGPTWCAVVSGGFTSPLLLWFTPHVFMSASLLGWRWGAAAGSMSILAIAAMLPFREALNGINEFPPGPALDLLIGLSAFTSVALISYYGILFSRSSRAAERKLKDAQLSLLQQKHAMDVHSIVAVTDRRGRITSVNDLFCEISQYSRDELIGQNHRLVNSGHHPRSFWKHVWKTIAAGQVWRGEVKNKAKDGSIYWVDTSLVPICDRAGKPQQYIAIRTDVTARKRAEREAIESRDAAEAAAQIKSNFLATMSHEIRTPMNGVSGMAHLLGETQLTDEQRQYLDALSTSSSALLTLIDDVLDYSKIEAGKLEIDPQVFSLRKMVEGVDELMSLKAGEKGLRFAAVVDRSVPDKLVGDAGRLRQILVNFGNNAVKFTEHGFVTLRVQAADPEVTAARRLEPGEDRPGCLLQFSVQDTGIGMSPEVLNKLFSPFVQADASTTRKFGGTGLGLSISKELCELMGGQVTVKSVPGEGSTFAFAVSLHEELGAPSLRDSTTATVILISEPDDGREVIEEGLAFLGAKVAVVTDVAAALHAGVTPGRDVQSVIYRPSLLGTDAFEAVEQILSAPSLGGLRLVVILPIQQLHRSARLREAGAAEVLGEPVRLVKLLEALRSLAEAAADLSPVESADRGDLCGRVLLVDDNEINRLIARRLLEKMGLEVSACENGQEAIEAVEEGGFDLVLMDGQMPIMDGYEATRRLRELGGDYSNERLPIVALTAGVMAADRAACFAAGMNDYLAKPIVPERLRAVVQKYLPTASTDAVA